MKDAKSQTTKDPLISALQYYREHPTPLLAAMGLGILLANVVSSLLTGQSVFP